MRFKDYISKFKYKVLQQLKSGKVLYFYFLLSLALPNIVLSFTEDFTFMERCANIVLPLGIYMLVVSLSGKLGRTIWLLLPVILMGAMQIVLLNLYGRSIIAVDMLLNLTSTNPGEAGELLGNLWPVVLFVCVLYLPSLILGIRMMIKKVELPSYFTLRGRITSACLIGAGVVCILICFATDKSYALRKNMYPVNVAYNLTLATKHTEKLMNHDKLTDGFIFDCVEQHPDSISEIYVLVVGETSRADHWQINGYERPTNPKLSQRKDIFSFPKALSESNTTHKSVPLLLSHLDSSTYGDSIYVVKSILSLFREAGFHTAFISNQRRNGSFIDFFGEEADTTIFLKDNPASNFTGSDLDLLEEFDKIISPQERKQLIVLHTYGSHFSYRDRYTDLHRKFTPDDYKEASLGQKEKLINAYDNTILLTDDVLAGVIERIEHLNPDMAAMIYTSDHGEDLYDDNRNLFLHASPCPSFYQLRVPFVVWLSQGYAEAMPNAVAALHRNQDCRISSSRSFFDTATRLAGISTSRSKCPDNVASMHYREPGRFYLDDHNQCVAIKESGFLKDDILQMIHLDGHRFLTLQEKGSSSRLAKR